MAVLALSAVGAAAGAAIGGTFLGVSAASWGWMAGSMLGNALFAENVDGPRLNDLRVTGTEYGATIPWVAGSPRIAGQIVWASAKRETANTQSAKGGPEQTTYTYDCDLLILLTENEIAGVSRIWSNSELVFGDGTIKSGVWANISIYTGADDQMPDPVYEAAVGAGNAPAYRGRGYVVVSGLQLGGSGQIPNLTFEVNQAAAFDPYFDDVLVLLHADETYPPTDSSPNNWATTLNNGTFYSSGVFSSAFDFYLDSEASFGPGAYVSVAYSGGGEPYLFDAGTDFTVEFFIYVENFSNPQRAVSILSNGGSTSYGINIYHERNTGRLVVATQTDEIIGASADTQLPVLSWTHVAIARESGTVRLFIGGVLKASAAFAGHFGVNGAITVGGETIANLNWSSLDGRLTEVRLTANVARYTDSFTVPADRFPDAIGSDFQYYTDGMSIDVAGAAGLLMLRAGYDAADFDVADMEDPATLVRGLALSSVSASRTGLDVLKSAYFFESSKSDKIYIRPRAATPVATISYVELGAGTDAGGGDQAFELTKSNDLEVPAQIALSYANMAGDYNSATEYSDRVLSQQETISGVQLPLGLLPAEAKAIADGLIIDAASSVVRATLRVPLKYAYIEPGDVFNAVNDDGRTYRLRVQTKRDSLTLIELECVLDDVGALDSAAVTDAGYTEAAVVQVAASEFEALDIPILRDADNGPGYYIGVAPDVQTDPYEWKGALVARSWDDVSYAELFQATTASVMGACSTTLGNWTGGNVWDESNTLTVVTTGGELASSTKAAMQLDPTLNVAAIGSQATGWEIVRFVNATLTAANTYVLSGLHRGFRGTEWRMGSHVASEQFVLLNAGVGHVASQTNQIGLVRHIKVVTFGLLLSSATSEAFTDTGVALKPFSPANPVALASGSDLVVTWQRRTRVSYTYLGATPTVPLGESAELYRVRIYDGATLVRTDTVATPTYTYTAANLASDGFASTDPVTFEICQVSEIVGAGYPATIQGTAP